ncbi:MAG TPA: hypothetical protein ENH05_06925 [Rhizobiales bacterium]|nr:hypothetical protein BMS3Bbin10_02418 [bacterium BMS3Bbin10]HDO52454.1 hypothetical protein [Hyphomicrobiales bacterium]
MASELRILRFNLGEVAMALRALGPRIGLALPEGDITSAENDAGQETPATCFAVSGCEDNLSVPNGKLAASLIHYCGETGIALPRESTKEIYVSPQYIELRFAQRHTRPAGPTEANIKI